LWLKSLGEQEDMLQFELNAELRADLGKRASRRLRRAGQIPVVLYGAGKAPLALQLNHNEMLQQLAQEAFYSHILTLRYGGSHDKVVLKDLQRHPYKTQVLHMDFLRVDENEKLTMRVPLHFINEDRCIGIKQQGGIASHLMTEVEITCLPRYLPEYLEVDVTEVRVETSLHLSDLKIPEGIEFVALVHGADQAVFSVHLPKGVHEVEEETTAETDVTPMAPVKS
jgi:large subunit ribosomal protein L25